MTTWAQVVNNTACDVVGGDANGPHVVPGYNPNGVGWTQIPDGTQSGATLSDGVWTNPPPVVVPNPTTISGISFLKRFTTAERAAIVGSTDANVKAFQFEMQIAVAGGEVNLLDPDTIAGVNYLQTAGLIGSGRATAILTP